MQIRIRDFILVIISLVLISACMFYLPGLNLEAEGLKIPTDLLPEGWKHRLSLSDFNDPDTIKIQDWAVDFDLYWYQFMDIDSHYSMTQQVWVYPNGIIAQMMFENTKRMGYIIPFTRELHSDGIEGKLNANSVAVYSTRVDKQFKYDTECLLLRYRNVVIEYCFPTTGAGAFSDQSIFELVNKNGELIKQKLSLLDRFQ